MLQARLRANVAAIGQALREPEGFALRWHREGRPYDWSVFAALSCTAILGTTTYGLTMGLLGEHSAGFQADLRRMLHAALYCTTAAGVAWSVSLPALYILNSLSGSRLRVSTTFLAALVTTSWGGLAMIASIPINWFFTVAIPHPLFILFVNFAVFGGVGVAMVDVFSRVMASLEPARGRLPAWWLTLVGAIGGELFYAFGLFNFPGLLNSF